MSSSSSPPAASAKPKHKKKTKETGRSKEKTTVQAAVPEPSHDNGRNEGIDPNWAYKPPSGMVTMDTTEVSNDFDWDSLKNDESKELWIVRLPAGFKVKTLDGLQVQQPRDARKAKLATLERKRAKYDVWSVDPSPHVEEGQDDGAEDHPPRGEEIKSVSCLLPRKKKDGRLYISPKPISQHIIVTHAPAAPHVDIASTPAPSTRHCVPKHLLKHRFLPIGATSSDRTTQRLTDAMAVDVQDDAGGKVTGEKATGEKVTVAGQVTGAVSPMKEKRTPTKKASSLHPVTEEKAGKKRKKAAGVEGETPTPKSSKKIRL